jgi:pterin-4a-carbinolamine dehydratase
MRTHRVSNLLREYFEHEVPPQYFPRDFSLDTRALPIAPKSESRWYMKQSPERLCRVYEFNDRGSARSFINEVMDYEDRTSHHGELRCKGPVVTIEVFTHDVDCVTELDKEYANEAEQIYNDICSYGYR